MGIRSITISIFTLIFFFSWGRRLPDLCISELSHPIPFSAFLEFVYMRGFISGNLPHWGIDISVPEGSDILSLRSGVLETVKWDRNLVGVEDDGGVGFGYYLIIRYNDGHLGYYAHLLPDSQRHQIGEAILAGEIIALSGNSGKSTGPHLHYGERDREGKWIDPSPIIVEAHLRDHPSRRISKEIPFSFLKAHRFEKRKQGNCRD